MCLKNTSVIRPGKERRRFQTGTVIFSYPKYFRYEDPRLSCTVEDNRITVKAETYAKSVEILNDQEDLVLSDNYFDLNGRL